MRDGYDDDECRACDCVHDLILHVYGYASVFEHTLLHAHVHGAHRCEHEHVRDFL